VERARRSDAGFSYCKRSCSAPPSSCSGAAISTRCFVISRFHTEQDSRNTQTQDNWDRSISNCSRINPNIQAFRGSASAPPVSRAHDPKPGAYRAPPSTLLESTAHVLRLVVYHGRAWGFGRKKSPTAIFLFSVLCVARCELGLGVGGGKKIGASSEWGGTCRQLVSCSERESRAPSRQPQDTWRGNAS
jgi:hypothetical protein